MNKSPLIQAHYIQTYTQKAHWERKKFENWKKKKKKKKTYIYACTRRITTYIMCFMPQTGCFVLTHPVYTSVDGPPGDEPT